MRPRVDRRLANGTRLHTAAAEACVQSGDQHGQKETETGGGDEGPLGGFPVGLASESFQGSQGRAYLFNSVVNVGCGPAEERVLLTGLHAVADIYCENCKTTLGWKYEHAFESSQKYKEGKFIIELAHMVKDNGWE
ncbi:hypothetical protein MJG53_014672 [Ovis ammon polii x Ovis aries]|uniref:Uncharacterized protein n=1 Tax=Ovis ammon polii x Ovis aries TaxID=2918886 RepID=A0ACB9UH83_9CETA|nr:hypothetical protein MJG53_014672 [Ovis ammon polii x Ovis aries]